MTLTEMKKLFLNDKEKFEKIRKNLKVKRDILIKQLDCFPDKNLENDLTNICREIKEMAITTWTRL